MVCMALNTRRGPDGTVFVDHTGAISDWQERRFVYLKKDHLPRALEVANDLHDIARLHYGVLEAVGDEDARRHLGDGFYVQECWMGPKTLSTIEDALDRWRCVEAMLDPRCAGFKGGPVP